MNRRVLAYLSAVAALAGCFGGDTARPDPKPDLVISDGAHPQTGNDNPDFFFLPTSVSNPVNDPDWDDGDFNPNLVPTVEICALDLPSTAPESAVTPTTPCRTAPPGYFTSFSASLGGEEHYDASWGVPNSDADVYYRFRVKVGTITLGYADIHTVANPNLLHTVDDTRFIGQQDGSNLPVRFRIEVGALCNPPGLRPCNSGTIQETVGGDVTISTDGSTQSGVHQPGQPQGSQGQHTLTVQPCTNGDLNPRVIDLPTFGSCITVSATPALTSDLANPAIVEVCDLAGDITSSGVSEEQEARITLHRLNGSVVTALPHIEGCAIVHGDAQPSFRGALKEFARGNLGSAVGKLASLLGPTPLNARRRRLNLGAGSATKGYSDFQFALPCKMAPHSGNAQTAGVTTTLPTDPAVIVTDLDGDPCNSATVQFAATDGSLTPASVTTAADGIARVDSWTLGPNVGVQTMTASGRGIAVAGNDGPRSILDPFMAIQDPFNPVPDPLPPPGQEAVTLQTGTQPLTANGIIPFGSGGYSYKQVASNSTAPTGWQTPGFNEGANGFTTGGTAPFRSTGTPCNYAAGGTAWARNTDILVRKSFTLASAGTVQVRVAVDRYAKQVYLNGVLLNASSLSWNGCAVPGAASDFVLTGAGNAGTNLVTIRASARSQSAFLDVRVAKP